MGQGKKAVHDYYFHGRNQTAKLSFEIGELQFRDQVLMRPVRGIQSEGNKGRTVELIDEEGSAKRNKKIIFQVNGL